MAFRKLCCRTLSLSVISSTDKGTWIHFYIFQKWILRFQTPHQAEEWNAMFSCGIFAHLDIFCCPCRPLMIVTQKITTLAFQVHDGEKNNPAFGAFSEPDIQSSTFYTLCSPRFKNCWQILLYLVQNFQAPLSVAFYFSSYYSPFPCWVYISWAVCAQKSGLSVYLYDMLNGS